MLLQNPGNAPTKKGVLSRAPGRQTMSRWPDLLRTFASLLRHWLQYFSCCMLQQCVGVTDNDSRQKLPPDVDSSGL